MRVNLARNIDSGLGIPICFVLSVFHKLSRIFLRRKYNQADPEKILFLELSEMGSAILAYSAIQRVKKAYPDAQLYFWIFNANQDSVHILNVIAPDRVISMRSTNLAVLFVDTISNLWRIRREGIDAVIDLELFSRFSSMLSYLSGAGVRIGFEKFALEGLYRGDLRTHKVSYNPYLHISQNFINLAEALKAVPKQVPLVKKSLLRYEIVVPRISSDREAEEKIWHKLKRANNQIRQQSRLVILNPGLSEILPLRKWPIENYIELTKRMLASADIFVVTIGVELKILDGKRFYQEVSHPRLIDFVGQTSVRELIDLYNISRVLISHDSGATNLAALSGINIIVLFGPETPALYAPLSAKSQVLYANLACSPCFSAYNHRRSVCRDNKCLQEITVDTVYNLAKKYL